MVADLVQRQVAVIAISNTTGSAPAAKAATETMPVVFKIGSDPVATGLVGTLSRPGKKVTGVAMLQTAVTAKGLELLHELASTDRSIAILVSPRATLVLPRPMRKRRGRRRVRCLAAESNARGSFFWH
jgi:putative ABC transport system substrate-binding protein